MQSITPRLSLHATTPSQCLPVNIKNAMTIVRTISEPTILVDGVNLRLDWHTAINLESILVQLAAMKLHQVVKSFTYFASFLLILPNAIAQEYHEQLAPVQVASFQSRQNAERLQKNLTQNLPHCRVMVTNAKPWYRVRLSARPPQQQNGACAQMARKLIKMKAHNSPTQQQVIKSPATDATILTAQSLLAAPIWPRPTPKPAQITLQGPDTLSDHKGALLSSREAILIALRHNPDVKNAEIDRIIQKYHLQQSARTFQWQYRLTGSANHETRRQNGMQQTDTQHIQLQPSAEIKTGLGTTLQVQAPQNWPSNGYQPSLRLAVTQPLLRGLNRDVIQQGINDALDNERINRMQLKQNIMNIIASVLQTYRALVQANNAVDISVQALVEARKTYQRNAAQIRLGKLARTINISQQSQIETLKLSVLQTKNRRDQIRQNLLSLLGLDPNTHIRVPRDVPLPSAEKPNLVSTIQQGLSQNIAYQVQRINYQKQQRSNVTAQDALRWRADLSAAITTGSTTGTQTGITPLFNGKNYARSVGISIDIPLDDLDRKVNAISARITLQKDQVNLAQARRSLISRIRNMVTDLNSQTLQLAIAERSVHLKQKVYDVYQVKLRLGQGSDLDALEAQNALIRAHNELINSKINYLNTKTNLHVLLGTLLDEWKISIQY